jgi:hypothetical protein
VRTTQFRWLRQVFTRRRAVKSLATVVYIYKVAHERYVGRESFPFICDQEVAQFFADCRQRTLVVHYLPERPRVSVLAHQSIRYRTVTRDPAGRIRLRLVTAWPDINSYLEGAPSRCSTDNHTSTSDNLAELRIRGLEAPRPPNQCSRMDAFRLAGQ